MLIEREEVEVPAMTYYKATNPDGTSFYDLTTKWSVGRIVRHPYPQPPERGLCSEGALHISDAPGETLGRGSWPCRLFEVEPRSELIGPEGHKYGCTAVKVLQELPAWQALGPNGKEVAALIERMRACTARRCCVRYIKRLDAAWYATAARKAAWKAARKSSQASRDAAQLAAEEAAEEAAWYAARVAAWNAAGAHGAWNAAQNVARDAALAAVVHDLITPEQYQTLAGPWESVMGPVFP